MIELPEVINLSFKVFLATNQKTPGIGNGVLQDILFNTRLKTKKKLLKTWVELKSFTKQFWEEVFIIVPFVNQFN